MFAENRHKNSGMFSSIKQFVFECILIPLPTDVENEEFARASISPHKVLVKLNVLPQKIAHDLFRVDLLQIGYVYIVTIDLTKEVCLEEDDLFGVRMQFGVEGKVARLAEPPGHPEEIDACWQDPLPLEETHSEEAQVNVVDETTFNCGISLRGPVKGLSIFVKLPLESASCFLKLFSFVAFGGLFGVI